MSDIGILVLAAGASSRMGKPKQLLKVKDQALIRYLLSKIVLCDYSPLVCVLGKHAELIKAEISDLDIHIVINDKWEEGMGMSIKVGIQQLIRLKPDLDAAIILLIDQPFVDEILLAKLKEAYVKTRQKIIASKYGDTYGVPALFDKSVFSELKVLQGATGAKKIILKYLQKNGVAFVDFPKGKIDLDTPEQYESFKRHLL